MPPAFPPRLAVLAALAALAARPARAGAQCGARTTACASCHETRAVAPVLTDGTPWHRDHAFGDLCQACHGGDAESLDEASAHAALVAPLAPPFARCAPCHGAQSAALAGRYVAFAATRARPSAPLGTAATSGPPSSAPPSPRVEHRAGAPRATRRARPVQWRNAVLAAVLALVGALGARFVVRNERRLGTLRAARDAASPQGVDTP